METDRLIDDYLRRLERAAADLPRARRAELVAEIRGHIETALGHEQAAGQAGGVAGGEAGGEAAVRNVLDRLGPPEDIVEAAQPATSPAGPRAGKLEVAALVALVVPFIGWLVGAVLVSASQAWSRRDKLVAAVLLLAPLVILGVGVTAAGPSGDEDAVPPADSRPVGEKVEEPVSTPGPVELFLFAAGLPSALYLGWQLRRGPDAGASEAH